MSYTYYVEYEVPGFRGGLRKSKEVVIEDALNHPDAITKLVTRLGEHPGTIHIKRITLTDTNIL